MILWIAYILFLALSLKFILSWVYIWQLKEYRMDRLSVHLRDTVQGKRIFFSFESFAMWILVILYLLTITSDTLSKVYPYAVLLFLLTLSVRVWREINGKQFKYPSPTAKAIGIVVLSYGVVILSLFYPLTDRFLWIVILSLFASLFVSFFVFLSAFPTEIYTDFLIQKAKRKRKSLQTLIVIAVSGSYGKSSTKEAIAHMLSKKYKVVKTSLSNNTPIAIAQTMLNRLYSDTDFFVVELGAYKKGEIAQLADMVGPTIGVTTAVSDQHIALYGTITNVIASEKELFQFLPKKSLVLMNMHNEYAKMLMQQVRQQVIPYNETAQSGVHARHVQAMRQGVAWEYVYKQESLLIKSPLLGIHTVENLLPAIFLGKHFGLSDKEIQQQIATLKPLPKTMEKKIVLDGITGIDDSFNASPESVMAAISYLKLFSKRKILVLSPLIELGKNAKKRHYEIGKLLQYVDMVFLTNKNFYHEIEKGLIDVHADTILSEGSYEEVASQIRSVAEKGDVILFEGKEAGIVLRLLQ